MLHIGCFVHGAKSAIRIVQLFGIVVGGSIVENESLSDEFCSNMFAVDPPGRRTRAAVVAHDCLEGVVKCLFGGGRNNHGVTETLRELAKELEAYLKISMVVDI